MHANSLKLMTRFRDKHLHNMKGCSVLDVGSRDINGSYRSIFDEFNYIGMDLIDGPNVDIVGYSNIKHSYDVVISGQVMEHIKRPWEWLLQIKQYCDVVMCIIAPNTYKEHRYPVDCYRFFPDGIRALFEYADIKTIEAYIDGEDTVGVGRCG